MYTEAFSFLNESRKAQIVELMKESGNLPVYYPGDAEVYMKAGTLNDDLFCAFVNIGLDNLDEVTLVCDREVTEIKRLNSDGAYEICSFTKSADGVITVDIPAMILDPVILIIK